MSKDLTQYVTTKQAAEMLGVTQKHIGLLLARGKIKGTKIGFGWLVYVPSLENYQGTKSPKGRPSSHEPKLQIVD